MKILYKSNKTGLAAFLLLVLFVPYLSAPLSYGQGATGLGTANQPKDSQITINNQTLQYSITGGTIRSTNYNFMLPALDVTIDSDSGGTITLDIPRNLIDSKDRFLSDAPFIVTINGKEITPTSEQSSDYFRTLTLGFDSGSSIIEIIGTGHENLAVPQEQSTIKITNPNPHPKDLFGTSISTTGSNIILGAQNAYSDNTTRGGMVYLYDTTGKVILSIADPDNKEGDQFGFAVASIGDKILVGAPGAKVTGVQSGKVYLFGPTGKLEETIADPDPSNGNQFGYSISVLNDQIIIGSPSHLNGHVKSGSVYIFDSSNGKELVSIQNPDAKDGDFFGFSMIPLQNEIAVGSPDSSYGAIQAGSVFVFDSKSGMLKQTLRNPDPDNRTEPNQGSDQFGFALASNNNYLIVGERGGDIKQTVNGQEEYMTDQSGNVRIYDINSGNLVLTIDDPTPVQNNDFGVAVASLGNKILIGMNHDDTKGFDSGSAYLYDISGLMLREIQNPNPTPTMAETMGNYFGSSVAFLKNYLVIGSPGDNTGATNAGAVYIIEDKSSKPISPLEQFKSGVSPREVRCSVGMVLVLKSEDGSPACLSSGTANILLQRGWAKEIVTNNTIMPASQPSKTTELPASFMPCQVPYPQLGTGIAVLYMPINSTGKICVQYSNSNPPQPAGIRIFEAHHIMEDTKDVTSYATPDTIQTGDSTVVYTIKTGNHAGFYGLTLFCVGMPFAVGYDSNSTFVKGDFPWLSGTYFCPAQLYGYHIVGLTGIDVKYIQ